MNDTKEEKIAALTTDRDTAMSMLEDAEARVMRLIAKNKRLTWVIRECQKIIQCDHGKGSKVDRQIEAELKGEKG